jgi:ribosomal protein S18 acetylase RimI-like enzyme
MCVLSWELKISTASATEEIRIIELVPEHARQVAQLHISGIRTGFISSLGLGFVTALYEAVAGSGCGYGFVAEKGDKVIGFAAFATNLNGLYKTVLFRNGLRFAFSLALKMFSFRTAKKVLETFFYPARIKKLGLPSAEFLSMVISDDARGKGLATQLVQKGFAEAARRGIPELKILAAVDIGPINRMYEKFGFERVGQIENHGIISNIYIAATNHFEKK